MLLAPGRYATAFDHYESQDRPTDTTGVGIINDTRPGGAYRGGLRHSFFISYAGKDKRYAEWIGWQLLDAGYEVVLYHWNFPVGTILEDRIPQEISRCDWTLALISENYKKSEWCKQEWQAVLREETKLGREGSRSKLLPVRIVPSCDLPTFPSYPTWFDLFDMDEPATKKLLLEKIDLVIEGRILPTDPPPFPWRTPSGGVGSSKSTGRRLFDGFRLPPDAGVRPHHSPPWPGGETPRIPDEDQPFDDPAEPSPSTTTEPIQPRRRPDNFDRRSSDTSETSETIPLRIPTRRMPGSGRISGDPGDQGEVSPGSGDPGPPSQPRLAAYAAGWLAWSAATGVALFFQASSHALGTGVVGSAVAGTTVAVSTVAVAEGFTTRKLPRLAMVVGIAAAGACLAALGFTLGGAKPALVAVAGVAVALLLTLIMISFGSRSGGTADPEVRTTRRHDTSATADSTPSARIRPHPHGHWSPGPAGASRDPISVE